MSNLVDHATRELKEASVDAELSKIIVEMIRTFASYGHSGSSAEYAANLVNALLRFQVLTPITDDPSTWEHHPEEGWGEPGGVWQNRRNSKAFSTDGGKTYRLLGDSQSEPWSELFTSVAS